MRERTPRRLAAVVLSTAIVIGSAGTSMAADFQPPRSVHAEVPVPGAEALLAQIKQLGPLGPLLSTVTDLLTGVLGGASPADATALAAKATAALDAMKSAAPAAPAVPTPAAPTSAVPTSAVPTSAVPTSAVPTSAVPTPAVPTPAVPTPAVPALPLGGPEKRAAAPMDVKDDAIAAAKKAIADLTAAVTKGEAVGILAAATAVLTGHIGVILAILLGGGLPVPGLPGLPLPKLPVPGV